MSVNKDVAAEVIKKKLVRLPIPFLSFAPSLAALSRKSPSRVSLALGGEMTDKQRGGRVK